MTTEGIGAAVLRKEDRRFLLGKGNYTDDITLPQQTYAVFVRSMYAHARIEKIDASVALAAPGVLAVFTGADIAADGLGPLPCGWLGRNRRMCFPKLRLWETAGSRLWRTRPRATDTSHRNATIWELRRFKAPAASIWPPARRR